MMNLRKTLIILSFSIITGVIIFSACTSDEDLPVIYPSNDELVTYYIPASSAPVIDGQIDDIWKVASKTQLISNDTSDYNPSGKLLLADMIALSDSNNLYILISWQDSARNTRFLDWEYRNGWNRTINDRDDNLAIFFQPNNNSMGNSLSALAEPNCVSMCHDSSIMFNNTEFPVDGWYWRGGVTNPIRYAIDLNIVDTLDTDSLFYGMDAEINPGYIFNRPDTGLYPLYWKSEIVIDTSIVDITIDTATNIPDTTFSYMIDNGEFLFFNDASEYVSMPSEVVIDSAFVPSYVVYDNASGSRWEVEAEGLYDVGSKRWTVEFKRPLNTGNPDDMVFTIGGEININIAINNNAKIGHFGFDPILLKF
jgi:Ethylbenzene dehydrogenase